MRLWLFKLFYPQGLPVKSVAGLEGHYVFCLPDIAVRNNKTIFKEILNNKNTDEFCR